MAAGRSAGADRFTAIVLGASNVSRGMARLATAVRTRATVPVDLFVAAGHGRSYGVNSRVWIRRLPSILGCGLWRALDREGVFPARAAALVTDVGNDLLYGFSAEQVAAWVAEAVARLGERGIRPVMTRLPMEAIGGVGPRRYALLKTLFVPGCPLSLAGVHAAAAELDSRLRDLAATRGIPVVEQPGLWYGFDSLHPRRRHLDTLWHRVCDAWGLSPGVRIRRTAVRDWAAVGRRAAEVRALGRRMLFTPQPALRFRDGGTLALY